MPPRLHTAITVSPRNEVHVRTGILFGRREREGAIRISSRGLREIDRAPYGTAFARIGQHSRSDFESSGNTAYT